MYEYMNGTITAINPYYIVLEVNQIGYQIAVANPFRYSSLKNSQTQVYLYQIVREDTQSLYGFSSLEEKQLFLKLISVSGIGPKSALAIMASEDHNGLVRAIEAQDVTYLVQFPGVGKKTAQQMILDLKDKLGDVHLDESELPAGQMSQGALFESTNTKELDEAIEALRALGYSEKEVTKLKKELSKHLNHTTEEYLRMGLKMLMKK